MKKFLSLAVAGLLAINLSSCGVASINVQHEGDAITQEQLDKIPLGTTQEQILSQFGEPSRTTFMTVNDKKENVWFYCWKRGGGGSFLFGLVNTAGADSKCATFVFDNDKLVSKGIGKGSNNSVIPTIKVQKETTVTHTTSNGGLDQ
jgi:outer membrane protein assembly factor BamE (lipoprotein component of BamABCDE complex)